jgi:hypothetical protein
MIVFVINTVVCEEVNYWFGLFKHAMKHMNSFRFSFFMFIILDIYNTEKIKLNDSNRFVKKAINQ